jgi:hypothetical protein
VMTAAQALKDQLKAVEGELINLDAEKPRPGPNRVKEKWTALSAMIDESDDAPTRGARDVYEQLRGQLEAQQRALTAILDGPVKTFNEMIVSLSIPPLSV